MTSLYIMKVIYKEFLYGFFIMGLGLQRFVDLMKYSIFTNLQIYKCSPNKCHCLLKQGVVGGFFRRIC